MTVLRYRALARRFLSERVSPQDRTSTVDPEGLLMKNRSGL
jgi:hypothetical protein